MESPDLVPAHRAPLSPALNHALTTIKAARMLTRIRTEVLNKKVLNPEADFDGVIAQMFKEVGGLAESRLGRRITSNADEPEFPEWEHEDRAVYIANHPTLSGGFIWGKFMTEHFAPNVGMVAKIDFLTNPLYYRLLGELAETLGASIFINYNDHETSRGSISEEGGNILSPNTATAIFPDGHRPYAWRLMHEQWKWNRKLPDLNTKTWMTETGFPKSGGLWELGRAVDEDTRFFDCTITEPRGLYGGAFYFDVRKLERNELFGDFSDEQHLRRKLVELWMRKNEIIRKTRSSNA